MLSPEPQVEDCNIPLVEDYLSADGFVGSENPSHWLRRQLLVSNERIEQVILLINYYLHVLFVATTNMTGT
jgi:hypothetical protein